jgi:hypothetical protein
MGHLRRGCGVGEGDAWAVSPLVSASCMPPGGVVMNQNASTPVSAEAREAASWTSIRASSTPRSARALALSEVVSRSSARTLAPAARSASVTAPPWLPVAAKTAIVGVVAEVMVDSLSLVSSRALVG